MEKKFVIWYWHVPPFAMNSAVTLFDPTRLSESHQSVGAFCGTREEAWERLNGDGQGVALLEERSHTSMSVGDVLQDEEGRLHLCAELGWMVYTPNSNPRNEVDRETTWTVSQEREGED